MAWTNSGRSYWEVKTLVQKSKTLMQKSKTLVQKSKTLVQKSLVLLNIIHFPRLSSSKNNKTFFNKTIGTLSALKPKTLKKLFDPKNKGTWTQPIETWQHLLRLRLVVDHVTKPFGDQKWIGQCQSPSCARHECWLLFTWYRRLT